MGISIKTRASGTEAGKPVLQRGISVCVTSKQLTVLPSASRGEGNVGSPFGRVNFSRFVTEVIRMD